MRVGALIKQTVDGKFSCDLCGTDVAQIRKAFKKAVKEKPADIAQVVMLAAGRKAKLNPTTEEAKLQAVRAKEAAKVAKAKADEEAKAAKAKAGKVKTEENPGE